MLTINLTVPLPPQQWHWVDDVARDLGITRVHIMRVALYLLKEGFFRAKPPLLKKGK